MKASAIYLLCLATWWLSAIPGAQAQSWLDALRERTCLIVVPGEVRNLIAIPGDTQVELAWLRPNNRPCQVSYDVQVVASDNSFRRSFNVSSTGVGNRMSVTGLQNGIQHTFIVKVAP